MCGIHFTISRKTCISPDDTVAHLLSKRGPDSFKTRRVHLQPKSSTASDLFLNFTSTVLSLRGDHVAVQPLVDGASGSILCWNGEAWRVNDAVITGNDSELVFELLLQASSLENSANSAIRNDSNLAFQSNSGLESVLQAFKKLSGPFAFVFYDAIGQKVFFGRDRLGRRSLLWRTDENGSLIISSVSDGQSKDMWSEVEADGIYGLDLNALSDSINARPGISCGTEISSVPLITKVAHYTWAGMEVCPDKSSKPIFPFPALNQALPDTEIPNIGLRSTSVLSLEKLLLEAVKLRVQHIQDYPLPGGATTVDSFTKVAILFSGGLDCTVLARLAHEVLPLDHGIDLINVAFENPRIVAAAINAEKSQNPQKNDSRSVEARPAEAKSTAVLDPFEICPDRITGQKSYSELLQVCPGRRWRFVCINVPYAQTLAHRETVISLIHPHNTTMDLSIAYAFYFAARGEGSILNSSDNNSTKPYPYTTSARILLSGLGADELFAGYTRHTTAFKRHGFPGLLAELDLDVQRLGKRNLGRDDRVISHWGKEVRFPFLDERVLEWALARPVWEKCGFGQRLPAHVIEPGGTEDDNVDVDVDAEKKVLRVLAWRLGMKGAAVEKKRAIQFGARTAKMEPGDKTKGTQLLS